MKNVLELLERAVKANPQKIAFSDENESVTYLQLQEKAKKIGTFLNKKGLYKQAVAVYMNQCVHSVEAMMGIVYSGNYYVVIDGKMPESRIKNIFSVLNPQFVICDADHVEQAENFGMKFECISEINNDVNEGKMSEIRSVQIDTDPVYVLFTSGSTGMPKGTVIHHKNVLTYSKWLCDTFDINSETVYGNQTPFYFSMSVSDVYGTLRSGATLNIIPKKFFSFPIKLIEFMNERKINTIYWVPSALGIVANWKALDVAELPYLKKIMFAGEALSAKHLNYWRKHLPDAMYANLFGPTETTDICAYWIQDREIADHETVPMGKACDNCECFIIDENGNPADEGELYVRGSFVAYGYFNNEEKTSAAFVQNPLNKNYPETVYKTGDLVRKNKYGEMEYISRKDFQIKHMGYRIELGEIEAAANTIDRVKTACVVYDADKDVIVMIYEGRKTENDVLADALSKFLPTYMMPSVFVRIKNMPYNANGKIDRKWLLNNYKEI